MVSLRYRLTGDAAAGFEAALERFAGPEMDNIHKQVAINLTKTAKRNLESSLLRPWESGSRSGHRLTGRLTGKHGRKSAIRASVRNRGGSGARQGRGVAFPDVDLLNRQAAHWRRLEYGDKTTPTMPTGLFLSGGAPQPLRGRTAGDVFFLYGEYARRARVTRREGVRSGRGRLGPIAQRRVAFEKGKRTKAEGGGKVVRREAPVERIQGKHFLESAWEEVVGRDGGQVAIKYRKKINEIFAQYR